MIRWLLAGAVVSSRPIASAARAAEFRYPAIGFPAEMGVEVDAEVQ